MQWKEKYLSMDFGVWLPQKYAQDVQNIIKNFLRGIMGKNNVWGENMKSEYINIIK